MIILLLIITGLITRLIPHTPNFAPIVAIALFSGAYLNKKYSLWVPVALYVISDLIIGLHSVIWFTWSSVLLITVIGNYLRKNKNLAKMALATLGSSVIFFVISNFGVWLTGWYPKTLAGLAECYTMAIPFFRISLVSNLVYVTVLFGIYQIVNQLIKDRKKKFVLLFN